MTPHCESSTANSSSIESRSLPPSVVVTDAPLVAELILPTEETQRPPMVPPGCHPPMALPQISEKLDQLYLDPSGCFRIPARRNDISDLKDFLSLPPTPTRSITQVMEADDEFDEVTEQTESAAVRAVLNQIRRASGYERYDPNTCVGRVYRKVRLRRSHDQQKLKAKIKRDVARKCRSEAGSVCGDLPEWEKENSRPVTPPSFAKGSGWMSWRSQLKPPTNYPHHEGMAWSAATPSSFSYDT